MIRAKNEQKEDMQTQVNNDQKIKPGKKNRFIDANNKVRLEILPDGTSKAHKKA